MVGTRKPGKGQNMEMNVNKETARPCTHKPSNSVVCSKKLSGASPYVELSSETSGL
jgi:hypothetical protein